MITHLFEIQTFAIIAGSHEIIMSVANTCVTPAYNRKDVSPVLIGHCAYCYTLYHNYGVPNLRRCNAYVCGFSV